MSEITEQYDRARSAAALFDQSARSKVEVTGPDAASFLHGLCTNDVQNLPVGAGCESYLTNAKAKVVAPILVYRLLLSDGREALWLDAAPGLAETIIKHLDHFLISEAVELADRTDEYAQFHLAGPQAKAVLERAIGDAVPDLDQHLHMMRTLAGNVTASVRRHDPLGLPGYDIVCLKSRGDAVRQGLLDAGAHLAGPEVYDILRVEAGTPVWGADIDPERFVVETGRIAQAICYTKGCFLGQEPIVMARDRGHVNRTLRGIKLEGEGPVVAGAKLLLDGAEAGQVTSWVLSPRLGPIGLAYVRRGHQEPGTKLEVETATGRRGAVVSSLPF
jgi:folate-binding protein YgfZ